MLASAVHVAPMASQNARGYSPSPVWLDPRVPFSLCHRSHCPPRYSDGSTLSCVHDRSKPLTTPRRSRRPRIAGHSFRILTMAFFVHQHLFGERRQIEKLGSLSDRATGTAGWIARAAIFTEVSRAEHRACRWCSYRRCRRIDRQVHTMIAGLHIMGRRSRPFSTQRCRNS